MKLLNSKIIILILLLSSTAAQSRDFYNAVNDTLESYIAVEKAEVTSKYERRIQSYRNTWESLIASHIKLQYAGGMGFISAGVGWDYGKRDQWETDILLGVIPQYSSNKFKFTLTLKQNYIPWNVDLSDNFHLEPLECGLYFNTVFSDKFWTKEPERYPSGYYGFSTRIRTHIFVGQRLKIDIPEKRRKASKSITLFYEISTSDLYVVSAFRNSYLKPTDYLSLSLGAKLQIL